MYSDSDGEYNSQRSNVFCDTRRLSKMSAEIGWIKAVGDCGFLESSVDDDVVEPISLYNPREDWMGF